MAVVIPTVVAACTEEEGSPTAVAACIEEEGSPMAVVIPTVVAAYIEEEGSPAAVAAYIEEEGSPMALVCCLASIVPHRLCSRSVDGHSCVRMRIRRYRRKRRSWLRRLRGRR